MLCAFLAVCLLRFAPIVLCSGRWGIFLCEAQKNRSITATGNRGRPFCGLYVGRGALTPPRGVGDAAPYSGEPRTFPLWQTSAKRSSRPGLLQPCRGRACPARGLTKAPVCGNHPGRIWNPPLREIAAPPTAANRGRTSRKPIFQQQPPPVVENFPGGRRFIVRK